MPFTQTLTAAQLTKSWTRLVDQNLVKDGPVALSKTNLTAAATAVQAFLWANRAAINAAIPEPAKTALTTDQKLALLAVVVIANLEG